MSRNLGILNSTYPYIAFLDSDDLYLPWRFKNVREIFAMKPDADGVYAASLYAMDEEIDALINSGDMLSAKFGNRLQTLPHTEPDQLLDLILSGRHESFHTNTITVKRELFDKVGLFKPNLNIGEDILMWSKMAMRGRLYGADLDLPVSLRISHDMNITRHYRALDKARYYYLILSEIFSFPTIKLRYKWLYAKKVLFFLLFGIFRGNPVVKGREG